MQTTDTGVGQEIRIRFPSLNKNNSLEENDTEISNGWNTELCKVEKHIYLSAKEWNEITESFLSPRPDLWEEIGGSRSDDERLEGVTMEELFSTPEFMAIFRATSYQPVVRVSIDPEIEKLINHDDVYITSFFVNTEGHQYARYVGRVGLVEHATV